MTELTATTKQTVIAPATPAPDLTLIEYGSRQDVLSLARRIQTMLPSGAKLSLEHAMAAAQYAILTDANIFRGEIYAWDDVRGDLVLDDGYKILVRWAKRQCPYSQRFDPMGPQELPAGAIGVRCWILRDDARPLLRDLIQGGATWREAFEIAATPAVGIVTTADRLTREGKEKKLPTGWTWEQRAETRALKNALNRSHGAPSPREIARESWMVDDTQTIPADWEGSELLPIEARERLAEKNARARLAQPDPRTPQEILADGNALLHGSQEQMDLV